MVTSETMVRPGIYLAPLDDEAYTRFKEEGTPVPKATMTSENFVVRYPPRDHVVSRHRLQVDVEAPDEATAILHAEQIANRFAASLSLTVPGGRYVVEMRKIRRAGERQEISAWSQPLAITGWSPPKPFESDDLATALATFDLVEIDEVAENAYVHLLTAWQLQSTAGSKPLQRSILQHYVLCVETIVNGIMAPVRRRRADAIRLAEHEFAAGFAVDLARRSDKPEAIRAASTRLRELSMTNMLPSIDMTASILELEPAVVRSAKELYRFRSSSLSHPGRTKPEGLRKWLQEGPTIDRFCAADVVARAFLTAYCAHAHT
ncbi:hypothetical protein [Sphingomonas sp.]|uniref:hypothetical protein n=1 Tax=Sphingomonas sp. TaxID=28214 RepID=UPI002ED84957